MKIGLNTSKNNTSIDSNDSSTFEVAEDNLNDNKSCIFTDTKDIKNENINGATIFSSRTTPNLKNEQVYPFTNIKTKSTKVDKKKNDKILTSFSTQAQTQLHTLEESNQLAILYMNNLQKDFGLTKKQAAGITGNLWHESAGLNAGMNQNGNVGQPSPNMADDNQHGYGIAQWGGIRKQGLIDYAQKNGIPPSSDAANYGYLKQELEGKYNDVIMAVKNTQSVYAATITFEQTFERATEPNMNTRLAIVDKLMDL